MKILFERVTSAVRTDEDFFERISAAVQTTKNFSERMIQFVRTASHRSRTDDKRMENGKRTGFWALKG